MTPADIGALISQYGFPIVMCGALFWYMTKQDTRYSEQMKQITDAYNELRLAIVQLTGAIGGDKND